MVIPSWAWGSILKYKTKLHELKDNLLKFFFKTKIQPSFSTSISKTFFSPFLSKSPLTSGFCYFRDLGGLKMGFPAFEMALSFSLSL